MALFDLMDAAQYHFSAYAIPTFAAALGILLLGGRTALRERFSSVSLSFFWVTLTISVWLFSFSAMYSAANPAAALLWAKTAYLGVPFIPSAYYQFSAHVIQVARKRSVLTRLFWAASALFSLLIVSTDKIITGLYQYSWGYYPRYGPLSIPYLVFFFGVMALTFCEYVQGYRRSGPGTRKLRIKSFLIASSVAYAASLDYLAKYGVALYPFGYLAIFAFLILTARIIHRYHLVDLTPSFAASEIIATMPDPLIVCDADGLIKLVNQAVSPVLGYSESDLIGQPIEMLAEPTRNGIAHLRGLLASPSVRGEELRLKTKGGLSIDVSLSISHLKERHQTTVGTVLIVQDIRKRKLSEALLQKAYDESEIKVLRRTEELSHANAELKKEIAERKQLERAKDEFVGMVSHELRTPLASIHGAMGLVARDALGETSPRLKEMAALAHKNCERLMRLINDILDSQKIESGQLDFKIRPVEISSVVKQAMAVNSAYAETFNVKFLLKENLAGAKVMADGDRLMQVLTNLLSNAAKFSPRNESVEISIERRNSKIRVSVTDHGAGIPEEFRGRIFQKFSQASSGQAACQTGTGLGLWISQAILSKMGGEIDFKTENRLGTTFYFELPEWKEK